MPLLPGTTAPLTVAMWDFSWLLRHHRGGSFADWAGTLDGLVERGYTCIRIDCFPHMVAAPVAGERPVESFTAAPRASGMVCWGNEYTVDIAPREALRRFIPLAVARGIKLALSTWWITAITPAHHLRFQSVDEFVRAWDETLRFLHDECGAGGHIAFVDLLNEQPLYHGWEWFHRMLRTLDDPGIPGRLYNPRQVAWYNQVTHAAITALQARWPRLLFTASQTRNLPDDCPYTDLQPAGFGCIDRHMWFVIDEECRRRTGYWTTLHRMFGDRNDAAWAGEAAALKAWWRDDRDQAVARMDAELAEIAAWGAKHRLPVGNTEGWGPIFWWDHPALDWEWTKECGELGARLGAKHGFAFNCTANFTHPHFAIWDDVVWHRRCCEIILGRPV